MPNPFPTEAANDPGMDDDKSRGRADTPAHHSRTRADSRTGDAKPGKDINQAGFIRERDRDPGKD